MHPLTADYWRLIRRLARTPAEVVVPAHPLSPDATVDDVLPMLLELVTTVTTAAPALPIVLMGDSAGGALVLVLATRLRDRGGELPAGVVALSPWLDATLDGKEVADLEARHPARGERSRSTSGNGGCRPARPRGLGDVPRVDDPADSGRASHPPRAHRADQVPSSTGCPVE